MTKPGTKKKKDIVKAHPDRSRRFATTEEDLEKGLIQVTLPKKPEKKD